MDTLRQQLTLFDGKRTDVLERIAASIADDPHATGRLATIAEESPGDAIAVAATWVILALLKARPGAGVDRSVAVRLVRVLERARPWETRLHVLQALARMEPARVLTPAKLRSLASVLLANAQDPKPFVRAWSLNLLGLIGGTLPADHQAQVSRLIAEAEAGEAASIKARLRQLRAAGGLAWLTA